MIFKSISITSWRGKWPNFAAKSKRIFFLLLAGLSVALVASCDVYEVQTKCGDHFEKGDRGQFDTSQPGLARDTETNTIWYRCPGGKTFLHHRCKGETVLASWDEAMGYAEEVSKKAGATWRLPTRKEMKSIMESSCNAPTINVNVFPDAEVANFWTSSSGLHQDQFRCSVNTFNGSVSCRQIRTLQQPFMLVKD